MSKHIYIHLTDANIEKILSKIPNGSSGKTRMYPFLKKRINQFCRGYIYPRMEELKKPTSKIRTDFNVEERKVGNSTNIELLELFARHNKISMAKVVHLYIIFALQEDLIKT